MITIREFTSHEDALRQQQDDIARGYRVGTWFAYRDTTSYTVDYPDPVPPHYAGELAADEGVRRIAAGIAAGMIEDARSSGDDPIAWVTGSSYMPPLRSFAEAEQVWQATYPVAWHNDGYDKGHDYWALLSDELGRILGNADVALECPDWDNSLYVVDLRRFEYDDMESETWVKIA